MKIIDFIHKDSLITNLNSVDKKGILEELSYPIAQITNINHDEIVKVLLEREQLGSTGIGEGIGIPHGKLKNLEKLNIGFGISRKGVNFESMDGRPTYIFFLLLTPENSTNLHLNLLAKISRILKNEDFREKLLKTLDCQEVINIINVEDSNFDY